MITQSCNRCSIMAGMDLCRECGLPIRRDNKVGVCTRTKKCRAAREKRSLELNPGQHEAKKVSARRYHHDHKEEKAEYHLSWRRANIKTIAVASARNRAKNRGLEFGLTVKGLPDIPEVCPVLGIPLEYGSGLGSPSLDRIDSARGYTLDNVHWISMKANQIKNNATPAELRMVADYFERLLNG